MDKDRKLERLLRLCDVPPARDDLAERIISVAVYIPQKQGVLRWIFGVFWSPVPAFCLALLLATGFFAGTVNYSGADFHADSDNVIEQLLDEEEGLL